MNLLSVSDIVSRGIAAVVHTPRNPTHDNQQHCDAKNEANVIATRGLYDRMVKWGWIDGLGRTRGWDHWQKFAPKYQRERE